MGGGKARLLTQFDLTTRGDGTSIFNGEIFMASLHHGIAGPDPQAGVDHRHLRALLSLWKSAHAGHGLPRRSEFTPETLRPWLGHIGILDVERSPLRFRIRLAGTHIVQYFGRECGGQYLDDVIPPTDWDSVLGIYLRCVESGAPQFEASYSHIRSLAGYLVRRLALPVTRAGGDIDQIVVGFYVEPMDAAAKLARATVAPDVAGGELAHQR
jgi:hypothetical protein